MVFIVFARTTPVHLIVDDASCRAGVGGEKNTKIRMYRNRYVTASLSIRLQRWLKYKIDFQCAPDVESQAKAKHLRIMSH